MIKSLEEHNAELKAFKSGDQYIQMEKLRMQEVRALEHQIAVLKKELADSCSHAVTIRNQWFEIFEQVRKECDRKLTEARKELAHVLRYLKDSMINEPDRTWNRQMYALIREMIHYRNGMEGSGLPDQKAISDFKLFVYGSNQCQV